MSKNITAKYWSVSMFSPLLPRLEEKNKVILLVICQTKYTHRSPRTHAQKRTCIVVLIEDLYKVHCYRFATSRQFVSSNTNESQPRLTYEATFQLAQQLSLGSERRHLCTRSEKIKNNFNYVTLTKRSRGLSITEWSGAELISDVQQETSRYTPSNSLSLSLSRSFFDL